MELHVRTRSLEAAFLALAVIAVIVVFWPWTSRLPVRESAPRSKASSNLRQIGQASLIYASDHREMLPLVKNIWDYAGELARDGGLNDAAVWVIEGDPANRSVVVTGLGAVLGANRRETDPAFRKLVPSWAVPLGRLKADMPAGMPIAWTRGLRADGTWAPHSPNGTKGGHIVFLGGNVAFYRDVRGVLQRYDGSGMTSNIFEALPPGTRIGEYAPDKREEAEWTRERPIMRLKDAAGSVVIAVVWFLVLAGLLVQIARRRWSAWPFVWFLGFSLIGWVLFSRA